MRWQDAAEARSRQWAGLEPGASRVWVCCNPADRLRRVGAFLGNTQIVAARDVTADPGRLVALADRIERCPPDAVQGVSNVLALLAAELERRSVTLPGTICISAGNHLTPWYRRQLETVFAGQVRERYAVSEVGLIAASCEHGRLHVSSDTLLVEVVGEHGEPLAAGSVGGIAVTMLRNRPQSRRLVGDVGRLLDDPCACGRGLPTFELHGRRSEQLSFPGGRIVCPPRLFAALDHLSIAEAQFRQVRAEGRLEVAIRRRPGAPRDEVGGRLAALVGPETRLSVQDVDRLEPGRSGKLPLVVAVG